MIKNMDVLFHEIKNQDFYQIRDKFFHEISLIAYNDQPENIKVKTIN